MLLISTADKIQVQTDAAAQVECHGEFMDLNASAVTPGRINEANITTATTVDVVDPPVTGHSIKVKVMTIANTHASVGVNVNVIHTDGTTARRMLRARLEANEFAAYFEGFGWRVYTASGIDKTRATGLSGSANTADQTANAADTYLTGGNIPIAGRTQTGTRFRWVVSATKTGAGVATPIWTIRTGTAGSTADTARLTFTGLAQTGVIDTAVFYLQAYFRAVGANAILKGSYGILGHRLAATGFINQAVDAADAVSGTFDSTVAGLLIGLSVNPGSAGVWTIKDCAVDSGDLL